MKRTVMRLYLPLEMGAVAKALKAIAAAYPDAVVGKQRRSNVVRIDADPDLTRAQARRIVRERQKKAKPS
jgi:hypothetical protein